MKIAVKAAKRKQKEKQRHRQRQKQRQTNKQWQSKKAKHGELSCCCCCFVRLRCPNIYSLHCVASPADPTAALVYTLYIRDGGVFCVCLPDKTFLAEEENMPRSPTVWRLSMFTVASQIICTAAPLIIMRGVRACVCLFSGLSTHCCLLGVVTLIVSLYLSLDVVFVAFVYHL